MSSEIIKKPEEDLTVTEQEELQKWRRSPTFAPISTVIAVRMYQLYLLGHTCEEIVHANENHFTLGMVLDARIRHEWDRRREEYLDVLYAEAGTIVKQRQIEGAIFLGDMLAAAHAEYGPKLQKFIQTRDPNDLPDTFRVDSITKYKMVVDAIMKITGQDKKEVPGAAVQVIGNNITLESKKPMTGQEGFNLLRAMDQLDAVDEGKKS